MRNRNYRLLLTASLISLSGDWIFSIGMMFSVYAITGSALASGAIVFTALLPHFLLGSVAGVFADRWDRRPPWWPRTHRSPPALTIVGVDEGGQVDTVNFNATRPPFTVAERREYTRLLDLLAVALAGGDLATVGRVATRSAEMNQARCPKRYLDRLRLLCRQVGGLRPDIRAPTHPDICWIGRQYRKAEHKKDG